MAKMTIDNPDMLKLLPQFMRDDDAVKSLTFAMDTLFAEPGKRAKIVRKWDQINNMNHAQLNEMAWELNIDWWDSSFSLETKRAVIKSSYRILSKRGTKWAVEELVTSAFGMGQVIEWFEYDGKPYMFKIRTNATLTKDGMSYFIGMIDKVKNARSHLEMIEIVRTINQNIHTGVAQCSYSRCVIVDYFQEVNKICTTVHAGINSGLCEHRSTIREA